MCIMLPFKSNAAAIQPANYECNAKLNDPKMTVLMFTLVVKTTTQIEFAKQSDTMSCCYQKEVSRNKMLQKKKLFQYFIQMFFFLH